MTLITGYVIDRSGVSQEGKQSIRKWRTERNLGSVEMGELTVTMNEALGTFLDEKMARQIRQKGRYASTRGK